MGVIKMDYEKFTINNRQAQKISLSIFNDIAPYLKEHQEEFKKWKKNIRSEKTK